MINKQFSAIIQSQWTPCCSLFFLLRKDLQRIFIFVTNRLKVFRCVMFVRISGGFVWLLQEAFDCCDCNFVAWYKPKCSEWKLRKMEFWCKIEYILSLDIQKKKWFYLCFCLIIEFATDDFSLEKEKKKVIFAWDITCLVTENVGKRKLETWLHFGSVKIPVSLLSLPLISLEPNQRFGNTNDAASSHELLACLDLRKCENKKILI